jgi:CRISPR-associated protein Csb1
MSLFDMKSNRILIEAPLKPLQGQRFQPTGFADLGAAEYERPDGTRMLLVESAQSMANRLEKVCLADDGVSLATELAGLPYVEVSLTGDSKAKTSSLAEAHRLNSPFVLGGRGTDGEMFALKLVKAMQFVEGQSPNWSNVALGLMRYDPFSILHGLFLANLTKCKPKIEGGDRIRIPRAITGFIEASDVREVSSGGVKNSYVDPHGTLRVKEVEGDVYSNVPYHRREFTARDITAFFAIDVELLRSYRLPDQATKLLTALALYKVRGFLDAGMRLRTACDFVLNGEPHVTVPTGEAIPDGKALSLAVKAGILECRDSFADPPVTRLVAVTSRQKEKPTVAGGTTEDLAEDKGEEPEE